LVNWLPLITTSVTLFGSGTNDRQECLSYHATA
jgi:hypothetical protein